MALEKATAIVLRVVPWSETSSIVTLFTREFGKVRGVAKGARRPKGPFESALDLLSKCRVVFARKSSDALDLLTEAKLLKRFRPPGHNLSCLYAGYYVAELLGELTDDYDAHPTLFDAADDTLRALGEPTEGSPAVLTLCFELAALGELGYLPSLEQCAECGAAIDGQGRVAFGMLSGGALCPACRPGRRHVVSLSSAAWQTLCELSEGRSTGKSTAGIAVPIAVQGELRGLMNHYLSHLIGHKPKLQPYLAVGSGE